MEGIIITDIIIIVLMGVMLYWIGGIYNSVRNGINEIVKGLNSIDERVAGLERELTRPGQQSPNRSTSKVDRSLG